MRTLSTDERDLLVIGLGMVAAERQEFHPDSERGKFIKELARDVDNDVVLTRAVDSPNDIQELLTDVTPTPKDFEGRDTTGVWQALAELIARLAYAEAVNQTIATSVMRHAADAIDAVQRIKNFVVAE